MGAANPKLRSPSRMEPSASCFQSYVVPRPSHDYPHPPDQDSCGCDGATGVSAPPEDAFMSAVLAFCSHMSGRLDALDNTSIYDEFRNYTAGARDVVVS